MGREHTTQNKNNNKKIYDMQAASEQAQPKLINQTNKIQIIPLPVTHSLWIRPAVNTEISDEINGKMYSLNSSNFYGFFPTASVVSLDVRRGSAGQVHEWSDGLIPKYVFYGACY